MNPRVPLAVDPVPLRIEQRELAVVFKRSAGKNSRSRNLNRVERFNRIERNTLDAFRAIRHGTTTLLRSIDSAAPSMSWGARLLSWQTYSNNSWFGFQRNIMPLVHGAVYAPGSSTVISYLSVV